MPRQGSDQAEQVGLHGLAAGGDVVPYEQGRAVSHWAGPPGAVASTGLPRGPRPEAAFAPSRLRGVLRTGPQAGWEPDRWVRIRVHDCWM